MKLTREELFEVVKNAPLVSIDLIVKNSDGDILLGLRKNEPAKKTWFVPGGRIEKNKKISDAFSEICYHEIGLKKQISDAQFLGIYEHFYDKNFYEESEKDGIGTHYVALAYQINIDKIKTDSLPNTQHYKWKLFTLDNLRNDPEVDKHTKKFFEIADRINEKQYPIVASRRQTYDTMLWQTPVLSLTAQAFLLTIALGANIYPGARILAALLSLVAALASIQLLEKHRHFERGDSEFLNKFEVLYQKNGFALIHGPDRVVKRSWIAKFSSFKIWRRLLFVFAISAFIILCVSSWTFLASPSIPEKTNLPAGNSIQKK